MKPARVTSSVGTLLLAVAAASCDRAPTEPMLPSAPASAARSAPGTALLDLTYVEVRHPYALATYVNRINARGEVVGDFCTAETCRGFVRTGDAYRTISYPSSGWTYAYGINERGDVVGVYGDDGGQHAYLYSGGTYRTLDAPAGTQTRAYAINATGTISGSYRTTGKWQPAIWDDGRFIPLALVTTALGAEMAEGFGINVHGTVVGHFMKPGDGKMYGFVYQDGAVTATLDYPGSGWMSCGWGVGVHEEIVGHYVDPEAGGVTGYVWQDGEFRGRLRVPGAVQTFPQAIMPDGTIAGWAFTGSEVIGFVATRK